MKDAAEVSTGRRGLLATYRGAGLPRPVIALGATSFFQDVASEMVYPLLPGFLVALGGGPLALGAMESIAEAINTLLKGVAGRWSDRIRRRKPFISAGYGLSTLLRPLMAVASAAWQAIALRSLDRVAKGLRTAPRDALIAEAAGPESRGYAFSFHRGLDNLGAAVGPLFAALVLLLAPGRLRLVFALATVPAMVGWLFAHFGCRETAPRVGTSESPQESARAAPLPRRLWVPLGAFFLFSLGNASDAFLLLRASELGWSAAGLTLLWSGFNAMKWAASAPAGRLADRWGPRPQILAGWALYAVIYLCFARVAGGAALAIFFALYALYYGLTEGAERALIVQLAGRDAGAGSSLGAFHFVTGLGVFIASLLFGGLWKFVSPVAAFTTGAALALAAALLLLLGARSQDERRIAD